MPLSTGLLGHNYYRVVKLFGKGELGALVLVLDTCLEHQRGVKENLDTFFDTKRKFKRQAQARMGLSYPSLLKVFNHCVLPGQGIDGR